MPETFTEAIYPASNTLPGNFAENVFIFFGACEFGGCLSSYQKYRMKVTKHRKAFLVVGQEL
ncbi:MAG TPA: hypothetical protein VFZ52_12580 [Chryseolinea sp.]